MNRLLGIYDVVDGAKRTPVRGGTHAAGENPSATPEEGTEIRRFREHASEILVEKPSSPRSKAALANEISSYLFEYLEGFHIGTHFLGKVSEREMLVRKVEMIPLEVQVRNVASASYGKRLGVKEGTDLLFPVIEHYYKNDELSNPLVNEFHIYSLNLTTPERLRHVNRLASKANIVLRSFFERRGLKLLSCSFMFGLFNHQVIIADEISPRTFHLAGLEKKVRPKRDRSSRNGDSDIETFLEIHNRIFKGTVAKDVALDQ